MASRSPAILPPRCSGAACCSAVRYSYPLKSSTASSGLIPISAAMLTAASSGFSAISRVAWSCARAHWVMNSGFCFTNALLAVPRSYVGLPASAVSALVSTTWPLARSSVSTGSQTQAASICPPCQAEGIFSGSRLISLTSRLESIPASPSAWSSEKCAVELNGTAMVRPLRPARSSTFLSRTTRDSALPITSWIQTTEIGRSSGSESAMVAGDEPIRPMSTLPAP